MMMREASLLAILLFHSKLKLSLATVGTRANRSRGSWLVALSLSFGTIGLQSSAFYDVSCLLVARAFVATSGVLLERRFPPSVVLSLAAADAAALCRFRFAAFRGSGPCRLGASFSMSPLQARRSSRHYAKAVAVAVEEVR